jgi:uncharacterized protein YkwD
MIRIAKKLIVLGACLALMLALAQTLGARAPTMRVSYVPELERAVFQFTNEVRKRNGVAPLTWENCLRVVARTHSADMLVRNYFSHNSPEGRTPFERIRAGCRFPMSMAGENIWMGSGYQAREVRQLARIIVDSWMSSPGHRKNLLHPDYSDIGVGVAASGKEVRVTQAFLRHGQPR